MESEKAYKARVEISMIVEIKVNAIHEDNAAAEAETLAEDIAAEMVSTVEYGGNSVCNYGIHCTEAETVKEE